MKNSKKDTKDLLIELIKDIEMVFEGMGAFLRNIWNFFTNPSFLMSIFKFQSLDSFYKKFLENETLMKLLALVGAILLVVSSHYDLLEEPFNLRHTEFIENQELNVLLNPNHILVGSAIPNNIRVQLIGEFNHVQVALHQRNLELVVDLRSLPPGTHTVPVEVNRISSRVDVIPMPESFTINIAELEEVEHAVEPLLINLQAFPEEWARSEPRLSLDNVQIRGAGTVLANIASVQAAIDMNTVAEGVTEFEVPITAFDSQMNPLDVEIVPDRLTVAMDVFETSRFVPLTYQIRGNPPSGTSISEIQFEPNEVEMFGDPDVLEQLEAQLLVIEMSQLNDDGKVVIHLTPPDGVQYLRNGHVTARVVLAPTVAVTLRDLDIEFLNLGAGLIIEELPQVNVQVRGAPSRVSDLTAADVTLTADLNNLGPGEHTINVVLRTPEFTVGELDPTIIEITIIE